MDQQRIVIAAFIDGFRVDSIVVSAEVEIAAAKAELLRFYPEAQLYRKL